MTAPPASRWFGQPPGLTILFLTETWEIFSYYGMRAILMYYMVGTLGIAQRRASLIYGTYTAAIFLTPIFGGIVSDRWLGRRNAVVAGGAIMAAGHFMMASQPLFFVALAAIAVGNGLFLPSLPSQVAELYPQGDPRRANSYNVYYVGINLGGFVAPLVCGTLGEYYGWHWGFGAAGVGMLVGLTVYVAGARWLPPEPVRAASIAAGAPRSATATLWTLAAIAGIVVVFRGAYEQLGNTIALWSESGVDRHAAGITIPMTLFQSLNSLLVIALTPPLLAYWSRKARVSGPRSSVGRMALGAALLMAAYVLLAIASAASPGRTHWIWLATFIVVLTLGELHILPVGLGLFGRLAPAGHAATAIAAWFLAGFGGNIFAGVLGTLWSSLPAATFFALMAAVAGFSALLLWLLDRRTGMRFGA